MKNKKFLVYIAAGLILVGLAILFFALRGRQPKLTGVFGQQMLFPNVNYQEGWIKFFSNEKNPAFYQTDLNGNGYNKISPTLDTPDDIIWSPDQKNAVLQITYTTLFEQYGSPFADPTLDEGDIIFYLYNLESQKMTRLDLNIRNIVWAGNDKIVFTYYDKDKFFNNISMSNISDLKGSRIFGPEYSVAKVLNYNEKENKLVFAVNSAGSDTDGMVDIWMKKSDQEEVELTNGVDINTINASPDGKFLLTLKDEKLVLINTDDKKISSFKIAGNNLKVGWEKENAVVTSRGEKAKTDAVYQMNLTAKRLKKINYKGTDFSGKYIFPNLSANLIYFTSNTNDFLYKLVLK